jgi:hypothetical protein
VGYEADRRRWSSPGRSLDGQGGSSGCSGIPTVGINKTRRQDCGQKKEIVLPVVCGGGQYQGSQAQGWWKEWTRLTRDMAETLAENGPVLAALGPVKLCPRLYLEADQRPMLGIVQMHKVSVVGVSGGIK